VLLTANLLPGFEKNWAQVLITVMDITTLRQVEKRLRFSQKEIGQFAYLAAHDMRAPLRGIHQYSSMLAQGNGAEADEERARQAEKLQEQVGRLEQLLDGLQQFSRIEQNNDEEEPVALGPLLNELIEAESLRERAAINIQSPLPVLHGKRQLLQRLFAQLLDNAVKFQHETRPLAIDIAAERQNRFWTITMADNGIGLDPQQEERVFQMFQRLHDEEDVPGIGMGLALVRLITEKHGGTVEVNGEAGAGAQFVVRLPVNE